MARIPCTKRAGCQLQDQFEILIINERAGIKLFSLARDYSESHHPLLEDIISVNYEQSH